MTNLGIVGSRHYTNYKEFITVTKQIIDIHGIPDNIISGGHTDKRNNIKPGTDTLAWQWANDNNITIIEHNAEWDKYGRSAGPRRNQLIVNDSDIILAFVSTTSIGTINTINLAKKDPTIKIYTYNIP